MPTIIGAAFAVSSLRALTLLAPFGEGMAASPLSTLLLLIAVFGVGILLSMSLFGVAFARLMSAAVAARVGQTAAVLMAAASIALGRFLGSDARSSVTRFIDDLRVFVVFMIFVIGRCRHNSLHAHDFVSGST